MKRALAIPLLALGLCCSPALASPGKLIDKGTDNGTPIAFAHGDAKSPRALLVKVTGKPGSSLEVLSQVTCVKGAKEKVPAQDFIVPSGTIKSLKKGFKRPDNCTMDVQAAYDDASIAGDITIKLYARIPKR